MATATKKAPAKPEETTPDKTTEQAPEKPEAPEHKDPEQVPVHIALARVMADVKAVRKEGFNEHQRYNFRGIDGVMNAVGPALRTHGVLPQFKVELIKHEHVPAGKKTQTQVLLRYELNFLGPMCDTLPNPVVVFGEANDYQDKALAKAHSVAYRTAMLQVLCLPTGEPDPDTYSDTNHMPQQPQQPTKEAVELANAIRAALPNVTTNEELQSMWREAKKHGVLDQDLKEKLMARSKAVKDEQPADSAESGGGGTADKKPVEQNS